MPSVDPSGPGRPPEVDGVARRTSPLTAWGGAASVLAGLALIGAEQALRSRVPTDPAGQGGQEPWFLLLGIAFLIANGAREILRWVLRTYTLSPDQLVIDEGVVTRHHRVVPIARVQQVDVNQKLAHQLFGLAEVRIATAGEGQETTVVLRLLERPRAEGLRSYLLTRRAELQQVAADRRARPDGAAPAGATGSGAPAPPAAPPPPEVPVLALTPGQVAVSGLGGPLGAVLVVLVVGLLATAAVLVARGSAAGGAGLGLVAVGVVGIGGLSLLGAVLTAWDLRVTLVGDDLHLSQGLLEKRAVTLPRRRVQHVTVLDNPLQRALGFVTVTLHSAAGVRAQAAGSGSFTVPWVARGAVPETLERLLGGDWRVPELTSRSAAAHRRAVVRRSVACALVCVPALALGPGGALLVVVGGCLGALWGIAAHHRAGWALTDGLAVLAHGALLHHLELVPVARIQSARSAASPFQRWADLATLHLDVAGSAPPHLFDLGAEPTAELVRALPRRSAAAA